MGKKILFAIVGMMLIASSVYADESDSAQAHVYIDIVPNIAVAPVDPVIDAGSIQTGDARVPITFRIDANTEEVKMYVSVSDLYKGNDPLGTEVDPIPNNISEGVDIDPTEGSETEGGDGNAQYVTSGTIDAPEGIFPADVTEQLEFESSQNGHFSQEVDVTPTWTNDDEEKPQGEYSGYVKLSALVGGNG